MRWWWMRWDLGNPLGYKSTLGRDKYPVCWMLVLTALLSHYQSDDEVYCFSLSSEIYEYWQGIPKDFFCGYVYPQ